HDQRGRHGAGLGNLFVRRWRGGGDGQADDGGALGPAGQQAGHGQGSGQRERHGVSSTVLAARGKSADLGTWTRASERDSSMQPMAMAMTATISTASSHPPVCTSSPKTKTP